MRTVLNYSEVAHAWAHQTQETARNSGSNFYFNGRTIYSYGSHFPIATIEKDIVFFTLRDYSNTTAKHKGLVRRAISHQEIIYCHSVPVPYGKNDIKTAAESVHEKNLNHWKGNIKALFDELGNKRIRNTESRINSIRGNIGELNKYVAYFKIKIKDAELKNLLSIANAPDFVEKAREAKEKEIAANTKKILQAGKAYEKYIALWREYDSEGLQNLPSKTKELCNYYANNAESFTRLRYNREQNRLETSKGVQIPADIAKRAFIQLNGCMEGTCKQIAVPVMNYTITETTETYIKAGCHTIPKEDVRYIANLLKW
jgi:hypothetical protein